MKGKIKSVSPFLIILMVSLASSLFGQVTISLPDTTASPGEKVTLPVHVENFDTIGAFQFAVVYDSAILNFDTIMGAPAGIVKNIVGGNKIIIAWAANIPFPPDIPDYITILNGTLMNLVFNYIGPGTSTLNFIPVLEVATMQNGIPELVSVTYTDGEVSPYLLNPQTATLESQICEIPGDTVSVPILNAGFPANVGTITQFIHYDSTNLIFLNATSQGNLSGAAVNDLGDGIIKIQWSASGGGGADINQPLNKVTFYFTYIGNVQTNLEFNPGCDINDNSGNNIAVSYFNGSVSPTTILTAPTITPNGPVTFCEGGSVDLTASAAASFLWSNGATTQAITVISSGTFTVTVSDGICARTSSSTIVTVNPILPVSVSVTESANPACVGASVTFTATPTNGGSSPTYQWKVNGLTVGTNSQVFSYVPQNNDRIICILASSDTCVTGNPATSKTVTMIVNLLLPVSVSISESANQICEGTSVLFTATPTNGGTTPSYQWKINGGNVGTNSVVYFYTPTNNDVVTCVMTSNAACVTGNPATSNLVTMIVNPLLPVSISITESENQICAGTAVSFTATPTNGGTAPSYQWKVNGGDVGTNSPVYTYAPENNDVVACMLTSNATCATGNPANSNTMTMIVNPLLPVSISITEAENQICAGTAVSFTATPTNGGTTPSYQWKVNGGDVGTSSQTYSYTPTNNDVVTCVMTSNAACATGSPATSNIVTMIVNPLLPVSISITESENQVCAGTAVSFTATPTNGGTAPSYQWKVNGGDVGTNSPVYTYAPANSDVVTCILTSNATCATGNPDTSNAVTMIVNPLLPVSISITESENQICAGTAVSFTATPTNGGTAPSYQWKVNGGDMGTNSPVYTYAPENNDVVACILTSNATCATGSPATSNAVAMIVNPLLPVSVTITESANQVCAGTSVTFTATPTNGGTAPSYQWKVNGGDVGTSSQTYSYTPANNDVVACILTSNAICATGNPDTSNTVTMIVNPLLPVSVTVVESANQVCAGTSVTFTATPTNGGTAPSYQWKVNGGDVGANSPVYTYAPVNNDVVTCILTSNITCASGSPAISNIVTMIVNPSLPVSVAIAESANPVCFGIRVSYTATPTNGGSSPLYQWKVNGLNVGANNSVYSYLPINNDVITCVMTSNATCIHGNPATSNAITMTVNIPMLVSISISESANPVCDGTSVTFSATPMHGGESPVYQWKVNGNNVGINSPAYSYIPDNNDAASCILTSSSTCIAGNPATSNQITLSVNPIPDISFQPPSLTIASGQTTNIILGSNVGGTSFSWTATSSSPNVSGYSNGNGDTIMQTIINPDDSTVTVYYLVTPVANGCSGFATMYFVHINPDVAQNLALQDITVLSGQNNCYNALQTITVAGSGTEFIIEPGGSTTMIAGQNILFYKGTRIESGGYLHGYIAPNGPFCPGLLPSVVAVGTEEERVPVSSESSTFKVYPNPVTGSFTLELKGDYLFEVVHVEVYSMVGEKVLTQLLSRDQKHEFSLSGVPAGLYFIHVRSKGRSETGKIIKL